MCLCLPISCRSSRSRMFFKIGVLKNCAIFKEKELCWNLFLIKNSFFNRTAPLATFAAIKNTFAKSLSAKSFFTVSIQSKREKLLFQKICTTMKFLYGELVYTGELHFFYERFIKLWKVVTFTNYIFYEVFRLLL